MLSLRQHFQRLKEIVDWSWTLAIMCMVGYITLGQLVQLYWAMVFFGGLAASFGLFYDFSCEKLAELNVVEDAYKLQKAFVAAHAAQDLLRRFDHRNPDIANQFSLFAQLGNQVSNIRATSDAKIKQRVNRQTHSPAKTSSQPPHQKAGQSTPTSLPQSRKSPPLIRETQRKITPDSTINKQNKPKKRRKSSAFSPNSSQTLHQKSTLDNGGCPRCTSTKIWKNGHTPNGKQKYHCQNCSYHFVE